MNIVPILIKSDRL